MIDSRFARTALFVAGTLACTTPLASQRRGRDAPTGPMSAAEASGFTKTSTKAEVDAFLDGLESLSHANRLTRSVFGRSFEGREMVVVKVSDPGTDAAERLRALVLANIHGGEVCGKEAVQTLLREFATGEHGDVLAGADVWIVPIYNVDGNERLSPSNRSNVNGPVEGLGVRPNAQGFDLNRDCIKVKSPECEALLGLYREHDPHVMMDLHTTNGSPHAYHLTYAPPLCTNVDPEIDRYLRDRHLPNVRRAVLDKHGYRVFDYGNFRGRGRRGGNPPDGPPAFSTFDHRPRFATNYYGLRNRLGILSEAYAYEPFEVRVRVTRAFVLENLRAAVANRREILALCRAADARAAAADPTIRFGWDTSLVDGELGDILVGKYDPVPLASGRRRITRRSDFGPQQMRIRVAFESAQTTALPAGGWAIVAPSTEVIRNLEAHGVEFQRLGAPFRAEVSAFVPTSGDRSPRSFQGHHEIRLRGEWQDQERELPPGTVIVPSGQRLARLAAQLLEPVSEDGLVTWNFFEGSTQIATDGATGWFPVARLASLRGMSLR